jgi:predicted glutamine amidotransferase
MPKDIILENCFDNNPDGAGLMYRQKNDKTKIIKGFMNCGELYDALNLISMKYNLTNLDLVFHFRYATQGKICPENCHPFPVTNKRQALEELEIESQIGIVHNGIISFCTDKSKNPLSDTQIFIKNYLSKIPVKQFNNDAIMDLIQEATNSKFIIMTPQKTTLIGNFILDNEIYYSNSDYKTSYIKYSSKRYKKINNNYYVNDDIICDYNCDQCKTLKCSNSLLI